jgi:hypothetical protein
VSAGEYLVGLLFFALTVGAVSIAAGLIVRRRLPQLEGATRGLAWALLATLGLIAVHVVPASLTLLSRETVAATALIALGGAILLPQVGERTRVGFPAGEPASGRAAWILAAVGCAGCAVWLLGVLWQLRYQAPQGIDTLSFHLPGVARWIQSGSIWQIDQFLPDLTFGYYPNNGDVVLLATVLPWRNDFITHFAMVPYLVFTAVAVYALGRELRAPAAAAALLGAMVAAVPVVVEPTLANAMPDAVMFSSFATGLVFLARHHRTGAASDLALGGLGLGVAFGTKWYGVSSVVIVVAIWAAARLIAGTGARTVLRQGGAVAGLIAASGGIWLLRNLVNSGDPVFPLKVSAFGVTLFDAPRDRLREIVGFTIADYFDQPNIWFDYLDHQYRVAAAAPALVLIAGTLAAAALLLRSGRSGRHLPGNGLVLAALALVATLVAVYVITPYSALGKENAPLVARANVRYVVPAMMVAAGLTGWAAGRLGRHWLIGLQALALLAVVDGLRTSHLTSAARTYAAFAVAAIAVLCGYLIWHRRPAVSFAHLRARPVVAVAAVLALAALAPLGYRLEERFNRARYAGFDPTLDWIQQNAPADQRIGLAGVWTDRGLAPIYPAFGPRLDNEVVYHGPVVRGMLRRYYRRSPFVRTLRNAGYDLLLIGRGPTFEQVEAGDTTLVQPRVKEEAWARAAGYQELIRSDRLILLRRISRSSGPDG